MSKKLPLGIRDRGTGQFVFELERPCKCGHPLGIHAAETVEGERPCFVGDEGGPPCDCTRFRPLPTKRVKP